jgi:hypothetical protein
VKFLVLQKRLLDFQVLVHQFFGKNEVKQVQALPARVVGLWSSGPKLANLVVFARFVVIFPTMESNSEFEGVKFFDELQYL